MGLMCPTSPSTAGSMQLAGPCSPAQNTAQTGGADDAMPSQQYELIQRIRRKYNQEVAEGRSAEDEEAIRELVL